MNPQSHIVVINRSTDNRVTFDKNLVGAQAAIGGRLAMSMLTSLAKYAIG